MGGGLVTQTAVQVCRPVPPQSQRNVLSPTCSPATVLCSHPCRKSRCIAIPWPGRVLSNLPPSTSLLSSKLVVVVVIKVPEPGGVSLAPGRRPDAGRGSGRGRSPGPDTGTARVRTRAPPGSGRPGLSGAGPGPGRGPPPCGGGTSRLCPKY